MSWIDEIRHEWYEEGDKIVKTLTVKIWMKLSSRQFLSIKKECDLNRERYYKCIRPLRKTQHGTEVLIIRKNKNDSIKLTLDTIL